MKFIDPLATLQYMGCAIPIHFTLAMYAIYVRLRDVTILEERYKI